MSCTSAFWWNMFKTEGAVYECPHSVQGARTGPLVAYAGTYAPGKHYVGEVYANMAVMERHVEHMQALARVLLEQSEQLREVDVFCGAPEGGKTLAVLLANARNALYVYPDQEVIEGTRKKKLVFARHEGVLSGKRVAIVEDVMNNFSTTSTLVDLIGEQNGTVVEITGIFNRSLLVDDEYEGIPVSSVVRRPVHQWRQDDPMVLDDVARGNVILKPKNDWHILAEAMQKAQR